MSLTTLDEAGEENRARELLAFRLGTEEYGINILNVQEIRSAGPITEIANTPEFIRGIIDLRGVIVPIVDLRIKFGLPNAGYDQFTVFIILNVGTRIIGIVVDSVSDVISVTAEQVKAVPEFSATIDTQFIEGIASIDDRMMILVDIERLMLSRGMQLVLETNDPRPVAIGTGAHPAADASSTVALNAQQITLVQTSFESVLPIADAAAELFYGRLFELDPALRPLFKSDMKEQGRKLMQMLQLAVNGLQHMERIMPALEDLGRRHATYGVKASHYDTVGKSLLWTLREGLGAQFISEVEAAWAAAFTSIAEIMKASATKGSQSSKK